MLQFLQNCPLLQELQQSEQFFGNLLCEGVQE
jgi:hypothetical protein